MSIPFVFIFVYILAKMFISYAMDNNFGIKSDELTGSIHLDSVKSIFIVLAAFILEAGATGLALYSSVNTAPAYKKQTLITIVSLLALLLLILIFISGYAYSLDGTMNMLSIIISIVAIILGTIGSGFYIWQELIPEDSANDGLGTTTRSAAIATGILFLITIVLALFLYLRSSSDTNNSTIGAEQPSDSCVIKGNISLDGDKIYHMPTDEYYAKTEIDTDSNEKWFCSSQEAEAAGWRRSKL